ncbi:IS5 family transposase [Brevibacillus agri]|uniref:IS5 family transposase n=2 Tax=Brevibacillus agri TaxID=51101 RepID=UPI002E23D81F|nr:IS5 family transposase [Brevibacillus agri]MED1642037.1 IS5 family transposase [Brevibacillus agri]MED1655869.1 IS5 family transposase [Brevibacillus agri]MED1685022.1 IS5 family transposase [Brevibacillus agri]MED1693605.1 IS5 family transposase [Brevibacillus agri]MED1697581.1 IS5 family transposase [Brevibacillus agri]
MYHRPESQLQLFEDFFLPFGGKLNKENRWVQLAAMIPWWRAEEKYAKAFRKSMRGQKPVSIRVALGALYIQERQQLDDRETVQQITENPYYQYFIGLPSYQDNPPFHHSLMTHFRKRLGADVIHQINEWILEEEAERKKQQDKNDPPNGSHGSQDGPTVDRHDKSVANEGNKGTLMLDATCAPVDISYPTDLKLLNEAREKLEAIIDVLHQPFSGKEKKPRIYRQVARKRYLEIAKKRRAGAKVVRKAIGKQLRYVSRNLRIISMLAEKTSLNRLDPWQYRQLFVISELYRQQQEMYDKRSHSVEDRIVSLSQPHVRPIVRGKVNASVEFGAKIAISLVNGYARMEKLSWDNFNESVTLKTAVDAYVQRHGYYPEAILADQIYRNRENLRFCKQHGIRLSGPSLGRPKKDEEQDRPQARKDAAARNAVEGKCGEGKRSYGLGRIRVRLRETSETVIALQLLVMNLERKLRILFLPIFRLLMNLCRQPKWA